MNLVLNEHWLERIEALFRRHNVVMQPNNRKQALLPATAEIIDNPIGTACGFELNMGRARFYFTPGVPQELDLMLDAEVIPRLLARSGTATISRVKRFHSFGLGESHADSLLEGIEALAPTATSSSVFRAIFLSLRPSLRYAVRTRPNSRADCYRSRQKCANGLAISSWRKTTIHWRASSHAPLKRKSASLSVRETFTGGRIAARLTLLPDAESVFRRGLVAQADRK